MDAVFAALGVMFDLYRLVPEVHKYSIEFGTLLSVVRYVCFHIALVLPIISTISGFSSTASSVLSLSPFEDVLLRPQ